MRKENRVVIASLLEMKKTLNSAINEVSKADVKDLKQILNDMFSQTSEMDRLATRIQEFIDMED